MAKHSALFRLDPSHAPARVLQASILGTTAGAAFAAADAMPIMGPLESEARFAAFSAPCPSVCEHLGHASHAPTRHGHADRLLADHEAADGPRPRDALMPVDDDAYAVVEPYLDRAMFARFPVQHQRMLAAAVEAVPHLEAPVFPCFSSDTSPELAKAYENVLYDAWQNLSDKPINPNAFEQQNPWPRTALDPNGGGGGDPTIITYSYPNDGTFIPSGVGEPSGGNDLNAFLTGIYGNQATWRQIYDDVFAGWDAVSGVDYIFEPNDDNVALNSGRGFANVRGDVRLTGKPIDGEGAFQGGFFINILAYNGFPPFNANADGGDMVIDTDDSFYQNLFGDSRGLRNVLFHEHGHGLGQRHVCPTTNQWLMQPSVTFNILGPQFDDILNAQSYYGDPLEPNDSFAAATDLGSVTPAGLSVSTVAVSNVNDEDYYRFSVDSVSSLNIDLVPLGETYQAGPQTTSCTENQPYTPIDFLKIGISLLDDSGAIITSAGVAPKGAPENISITVAPGDYAVRVFGSQPAGDQIVAYDLSIDASPASVDVTFISQVPSTLLPGEELSLVLTIDSFGQPIEDAQLEYRRQGDAGFTSEPLVSFGGNAFRADFPPFDCGDDPEFRIVTTVQGSAPTASDIQLIEILESATVTFQDPADVDLGYTVSGVTNPAAGGWTLGAPEGFDRGDPEIDADGSGSAWLTGITGESNSDVDNGSTVLESPSLDAPTGSRIKYSYWFGTGTGAIDAADGLEVAVSNDGGESYTVVRNFVDPVDAWQQDTLVAGVDYTGSSDVVLRFTATDAGAADIIEAGVDAIEVEVKICTPLAPDCPADINGDGIVTGVDFTDFISAFAAGLPVADQNGDGSITGVDFTDFISNFGAGCPDPAP